MATSPNPIAGVSPPPDWAVKLANILQAPVSKVTQPVGAFVDKARQAYSDAANRVVNGLAQTGTDYNAQPPANQQELKNVIRAGIGDETGIPIPSGADPKGDDKEILQSVLPRLPKGQMSMDDIQDEISNAASNNNTMYMTYQHPDWDESKTYHVEPYSYRGPDNQTLMAYDKMGKGIKAFKLDNVINVKTNPDVSFKPRWDVEIGKTDTTTAPQSSTTTVKGK
jgi:hypothetical protein